MTKSTSDSQIFYGGGVKAIGDGWFGGHGILFSDPTQLDLEGEYFDARTELYLEDRLRLPVLFSHGLDPQIGKTRLGSATFKVDPVGVWFQFQIEARSAYIDKLPELVRLGVLGYSTSAAGVMIEKQKSALGTYIKRWAVQELSLTSTPCEPRTLAVPLKSFHPATIADLVRNGSESSPLRAALQTERKKFERLFPDRGAALRQEMMRHEMKRFRRLTQQPNADAWSERQLASRERYDLRNLREPALQRLRRLAEAAEKSGARNSAADLRRIRTIHNAAAALDPSVCPGMN